MLGSHGYSVWWDMGRICVCMSEWPGVCRDGDGHSCRIALERRVTGVWLDWRVKVTRAVLFFLGVVQHALGSIELPYPPRPALHFARNRSSCTPALPSHLRCDASSSPGWLYHMSPPDTSRHTAGEYSVNFARPHRRKAVLIFLGVVQDARGSRSIESTPRPIHIEYSTCAASRAEPVRVRVRASCVAGSPRLRAPGGASQPPFETSPLERSRAQQVEG
ncbi:hypothetical protein B0H12DRAFT_852063 [Mycena haematopus]|nr:hypothetical protein B0H12DRAFT_852063 [Mycena haematopus]